MNTQQQRQEKQGYFELISAMILSGTIGMFVTFSQQPIINVVFYRCAIGSLCLFVYLLLKGMLKKKNYPSKRELLFVIVVGLSVVLNWIALFSSYAYTSIGIATTIYHVQPMIVFFVGAFLFKEKITGSRLLWLAMAFTGVLLIVNPGNHILSGNNYGKGCLLAFIAACLYSVATLASKYIKNTSPYIISLAQMMMGTLILLPFVQLSIFPQTTLQISSILILGVVHSAIMYILLYSSYQKLTTSSIAILSYIYPLVAIATDYFAFNKTLTLLQMVGGGMILAAGLCNKLSINPFKSNQKWQTRPGLGENDAENT